MKIIDYLKQLPEPYRALALRNYSPSNEVLVKDGPKDFLHALRIAFNWNQSTQGQPYWQKVYDSVRGKNIPLETRALSTIKAIECLNVFYTDSSKSIKGESDIITFDDKYLFVIAKENCVRAISLIKTESHREDFWDRVANEIQEMTLDNYLRLAGKKELVYD